MDVLSEGCSSNPAQHNPSLDAEGSAASIAENSCNAATGTQLDVDAEDTENVAAQANVAAVDSPSKSVGLSSRSGKGRLSTARTISQRSRTGSSRASAAGMASRVNIGTDIYIRIANDTKWLKVVTNANVAFTGVFANTLGLLEWHMRRAPDDPALEVTAISFHVNGAWTFIDSQEAYDEIHEEICAQQRLNDRLKIRVESAELLASDPRIPRLMASMRSGSAGRSRPKPSENVSSSHNETNAKRRSTHCDCFVDSFDGEKQSAVIEVDYGTSAQHVRKQLVAAFPHLTSAEVQVNDSWVQVSDAESFEQHREMLLSQKQVHWRLVVSKPEQRACSPAPMRRSESPSRGLRASRTPLANSSPLRSRTSVAGERTPSRSKFARPATPPRADRTINNTDRLLRTPTSSRKAREDAPQTPNSVKRMRGPVAVVAATASASTAARGSPCRPLAIPRFRDSDEEVASHSLPSDDQSQSDSASLHFSEADTPAAEKQTTAVPVNAAERSPGPRDRTPLEKQTPTVEKSPDWAASLRSNSRLRKSKSGRRSISTGRAGAKRTSKNLTSAQSVASLGLDVSNAQAHGLSECELFSFLQQMMGDSREEISWKLQAYREGGGFAQAEQEYQAAENNYIRLLFEMDSTKALLSFVNGHDVQRALTELSKLHETFKTDPNNTEICTAVSKHLARLQTAMSRTPESVPDLCGDVVARIKDIPTCEPATACRKAHVLVAGAFLASSVDRLRKEVSGLEQQVQATANSLETWDKRMKAAPDYQAVIRGRENEWRSQEESANEEALEVMRSFIPVDVHQLSYVEFDQRIRESGGFYPQELLRELKDNKFLHWLVMHPDDIKSANFLAGATARYFTDLRQYDMMELRAILAVLPESFELDRDGAKARWRAEFLQLVKDKVARVRRRVVPGAWNPVLKKRDHVTLNPLSDNEMRRTCYYYPTLSEMNAKMSEMSERREKLEQKKKRIRELEAQEESLRSEYSALLDDMRNKSLPPEFRQALSDAKDELKGKQDHTKRQRRKLSGEVTATEADLAANPVDEQQLQQELEALRGRISDYDASQTAVQVTGVFDRNPVIAKVERSSVSKYCPEAEALQRKQELETAMSQRAAVPNIETVFAEANAPAAPASPYTAGPRKSVMDSASPLVVAKLNSIFGQTKQPQRPEKVASELPSPPAATSTEPNALPLPPVTPKSKTLQRLLESGASSPAAPRLHQSAEPTDSVPRGSMNSLLSELIAKRGAKAGPTASPACVAAPLATSNTPAPAAVPFPKPPMGGMGGFLAELKARQQKMQG